MGIQVDSRFEGGQEDLSVDIVWYSEGKINDERGRVSDGPAFLLIQDELETVPLCSNLSISERNFVLTRVCGNSRIQLIIDFEISINAIQRQADRLTSTLLQPGLA